MQSGQRRSGHYLVECTGAGNCAVGVFALFAAFAHINETPITSTFDATRSLQRAGNPEELRADFANMLEAMMNDPTDSDVLFARAEDILKYAVCDAEIVDVKETVSVCPLLFITLVS